MKQIIENLSLATQLLGANLSVATLTAHTIRTENMGLDFSSLREYLKSEGFDNTLSKRPLKDIPSLAVPVLLFLQNEEAALVTEIKEDDEGRSYKVQLLDGLSQWYSETELDQKYLQHCWFIKPRESVDSRSELPEYNLP